MSDLLQRGSDWLEEKRTLHASRVVTYVRGVQSANLSASIGRTVYDVDDGYPPLVCDIAYALCKPQCDEKNVSDEEFGRAMGGDVLEKVLDLILEETVDFFPQGRRAILRKVLEKSQTFAEKAKALTAARLATGELDAAIDILLEPELKKLEAAPTIGIGSASSSPALPVSTPAPERSPS
jgi:hypothetical protein